MFFVSILVISPIIVSVGWFSRSTLTAYGLISDVITHTGFIPLSLAACSSPYLIPPIPAKRSIKRSTFFGVQIASAGGMRELSTALAMSSPFSILGANGILVLSKESCC